MRKAIIAAALVLGLAVLAPTAALGKEGGTERPFKFTMTGTAVVDFTTFPFQDTINLAGPVTHMGKITFSEHALITPTGPDAFNFNSTWLMVAANGDQVPGACVGSGRFVDPTHIALRLDCEGSSGTGRFEDASLSSEVTVDVTRVSFDGATSHNLVEARGRGTIRY